MTVTLGFDVEEFDFPLERGREIDLQTQLAVFFRRVGSLVAMLDRLNLRVTFYTTANFAAHRPETIRRMVAAGHEIASHGPVCTIRSWRE